MSMASTSGFYFYKIAGAASASYIKWNWTEETFIKLVQRIILGNIHVFCVLIFVLMLFLIWFFFLFFFIFWIFLCTNIIFNLKTNEVTILFIIFNFDLMVFNGHIRNKAYNRVLWACLYSLHQREKWGSTIQYGYRKLGTHARVFSQTLMHGNSKNEIRQFT